MDRVRFDQTGGLPYVQDLFAKMEEAYTDSLHAICMALGGLNNPALAGVILSGCTYSNGTLNSGWIAIYPNPTHGGKAEVIYCPTLTLGSVDTYLHVEQSSQSLTFKDNSVKEVFQFRTVAVGQDTSFGWSRRYSDLIRVDGYFAGNSSAPALVPIPKMLETLRTKITNDGVPKGAIMMWSGWTAPTGWNICDGNGGVAVNGVTIPDLRGRFIVGGTGTGTANTTDNKYPVSATGGEETHRLSAAEMPYHRHALVADAQGTARLGTNNIVAKQGKSNVITEENNEEYELIGIPESTAGATLGLSGLPLDKNGASPWTSQEIIGEGLNPGQYIPRVHENRPPYYALAYIIKVV
jgi:microcystin-dependent protein